MRINQSIILAVAFGVSLSGVAQVRADLLANESFDTTQYTGATLGSTVGGAGFSGSWKTSASLATDSSASVVATSLAAPTGYAPAPSGGSVSQQTLALYRALGSGAFSLDTDHDIYISVLAQRSAGSYNIYLQNGSTTQIQLTASTGGTATILNVGATTTAPGGSTILSNQPDLWVIKIAASSTTGGDQVFVKTYRSTDTVDTSDPAAWTVVSPLADKTGSINQIGFSIGSTNTLKIDEIRIGTTWDDVVRNVPEPASAMLSFGAMAMLALGRHVKDRSK